MKREKIEEKYKWRDSDLFASRDEFVAECDRVKIMLRKLTNYQGKLNTDKNILKFFNLENELNRKLERIIIFAYMRKSVEGNDPSNLEMGQMAQDISVKVSEALAFADPEISSLPNDQIKGLIADPAFRDFKRDLEFVIKNKPHVADAQTQKLVSGAGAFADFEDIFSQLSNIEMPIKDIVTAEGKKLTLTNANYSKFMRSSDRDIRRQAYENYYAAFASLNLTYSNLYTNTLKYENFLVKAFNFKGNFERTNFYEEVPQKLIETMLECVHEALPTFAKLQSIRKKVLGIDTLRYFDTFAPLTTGKEPKFTISRGADAIEKSLEVIGADYIDLVRHALNDRWVDLYPTPNKDSCSYCISCFDAHPYILTNYNNTLEAVSTLSHELGHAMQAYLASKQQPYNLAEAPSLTCEIASTVNEILTKKYLLDKAQTNEQKLLIIDSLLGDFYGAIFKQSMYTEFELYANDQVEKGESLSFDKLNSYYKGLIEKYFGKDLAATPNCEVEWSRLPHLYSPFYVYKYVVGFVSACIICGKLLSGDKDYKEKYLEFLKAGSSKSPLELLKLAEVDIMDAATYKQAFKLYELYIDELKELLGEN